MSLFTIGDRRLPGLFENTSLIARLRTWIALSALVMFAVALNVNVAVRGRTVGGGPSR